MDTFEKQSLISTLEKVKKGLATRELIEQSSSFIFEKGHVCTYNDEIFARAPMKTGFTGVVEAEPLLKLLSKIKDTEITFAVTDNELQIKGKKFSSGILFKKEILIPIDEVHIPKKFKPLPSNFTQQAKLACLTAGISLHEPLLTCVHIFENKVESCDNDRITICTLDSKIDADILIPASNMLKLCDEKLSEYSVDQSWIHFKTQDGVFLSTRLFSDNYVDLQQFIPKRTKGTEITFPKTMETILDRADIFSKDATSQEKIVTLSFRNGKMTVGAKNDKGWFKEKSKSNFDEQFAFTINIEFMKDILKITNSISLVENSLYFRTENSIHLIKLDEDDIPF